MKYTKYIISIILGAVILWGFKSDTAKDKFQKMKTLTQIIRLVGENYVDDIDMNDILEGAIVGLLDKLDPHSSYIPAEQFELINEQFDGAFEGIGIEFNILDGYITVISPIPGTPSDRAGLQTGDKIVRINDESAYKITQKDVLEKLRGPKGSSVNVTISRPSMEENFEVTLVRDKKSRDLVLEGRLRMELGLLKIQSNSKESPEVDFEWALRRLSSVSEFSRLHGLAIINKAAYHEKIDEKLMALHLYGEIPLNSDFPLEVIGFSRIGAARILVQINHISDACRHLYNAHNIFLESKNLELAWQT